MTARHEWSLVDAAAAIAEGRCSAEQLVSACLQRITVRDEAVRGWASLDAARALRAARACDASTAARGPLHGIPFGVKDIIDVAGLPTTHGCAAFAQHFPASTAQCVERLQRAGAIVLGKTVTTEFATYHPGPTRNPRDPRHTPGGSSSGSAATVADGQVPMALGTQTAGSIIRPASFCGVLGFKPSFGRYPLGGVLPTATSLDTLGFFARTLADVVLVDSVLAATPANLPRPGHLTVGLCRSPAWPQASAAMQAAWQAFGATLGAHGVAVIERELPADFADLLDAQQLLHRHEAWQALGEIRRVHAGVVSETFADFIDTGARVTPAAYRAALALQVRCRAQLSTVFDGVTVLLTPGAPDAAPAGLEATGNPLFNRLWTALGTPCLGFPASWTPQGLPLGLQLIGPLGGDRELLAAAQSVLALAPPTPLPAEDRPHGTHA